MLSGVVAAAGVVAYYSLSELLVRGGMYGGDALEFIDYISDFVSGKSSLVLLVSYVIVIISVIVVFKLRGKRLSTYSGMTHVSLWSIIGSTILGAVLGIITYSLIPESPQEAAAEISWIALLCVVVGPFVEEFMFRGILLKMFGASCGIVASVIMTSILFAVSHGELVQMLYTFVLGIILCVVRIKSTSLWSVCAVHLSFNISGALLAVEGFELSGKGFAITAAIAVFSLLIACSGGRKLAPTK